MKKILFLTGTRADYGKIKPLIRIILTSKKFKPIILATGMHMHKLYGFTVKEIEKDFKNLKIIKEKNFDINDQMDVIAKKSINVFSKVIKKIKPDLFVLHGDRVETLAASICCNFNNTLIAHIEGGEVSGTVDESLRHATSKLSHIHFVSNKKAKKLLIRMGEAPKNIFIIGSPEVDIMINKKLPTLDECKKRYDIKFLRYSIFLYHPVTTMSKDEIVKQNKVLFSCLKKSKKNYVLIFPNNDTHSNLILKSILQFKKNKFFKLLPSIRFEYYLTLLKNSDFIIGNSSSGMREAPVYGVPSINLGNRQKNRIKSTTILNANYEKKSILKKISEASKFKKIKKFNFGRGNSAANFLKLLNKSSFWKIEKQKNFYI